MVVSDLNQSDRLLEMPGQQDMETSPLGKYAVNSAGSPGIVLHLQREVSVSPTLTQFKPSNAAVVVGVVLHNSGHVQVLTPEVSLSRVQKPSPAAGQVLAALGLAQVGI